LIVALPFDVAMVARTMFVHSSWCRTGVTDWIFTAFQSGVG
jgi:hypothetical protein